MEDQGIFNYILSFLDDIICLFFIFLIFVNIDAFTVEPILSKTIRTILMIIAIAIFAVDVIAFVIDLITSGDFGVSEIVDIVLCALGLLVCAGLCLYIYLNLRNGNQVFGVTLNSDVSISLREYLLIFISANYFLSAIMSGILNFDIEEFSEYTDGLMEGLKITVIAFITMVVSLILRDFIAYNSSLVYAAAIVMCIYLANEVTVILINIIAPFFDDDGFNASAIFTNVLNGVEVVIFALIALFLDSFTMQINMYLGFAGMGWQYLLFVGLAFCIVDIVLSIPVNIIATIVNSEE